MSGNPQGGGRLDGKQGACLPGNGRGDPVVYRVDSNMTTVMAGDRSGYPTQDEFLEVKESGQFLAFVRDHLVNGAHRTYVP